MGGAGTLSSATADGHLSYGAEAQPRMGFFTDTSVCIGCKACEVACKEWNDLEAEATHNFGSYQSHEDLTANTWDLMRFAEVDLDNGDLAWLIRKDSCMHCDEPGCLLACPAPGAIVQYENGIVDFDQTKCIGCQYCIAGCPFDIPRFDSSSKKVYKCTMCSDRVADGMEPACVKACPTGAIGPIRGEWDEEWSGWWGPEPPYHAPVFVLTHHTHAPIEMEGGTTFHFVTDGFDAAYAQARETAGADGIDIAGGRPTPTMPLPFIASRITANASWPTLSLGTM